MVDDFIGQLDDDSYTQLYAALELLEDMGPALKRPIVGEVQGSKHHNMRELRPGSSGRSEIRVIFAFDPQRRAVMLVAGDKRGRWKRWYDKAIPLADRRLDQHLAALTSKIEDDKEKTHGQRDDKMGQTSSGRSGGRRRR
ncbi:MAG: type II toxin-antitoxin system RelE/ParE family toxin [Bifidobacteriaceae bacterium]|jgi:hypothetical protein|nr:type II toxin-antitoxin system RelE/ParE family toxin [Bifidobacteriaceae bacterium]